MTQAVYGPTVQPPYSPGHVGTCSHMDTSRNLASRWELQNGHLYTASDSMEEGHSQESLELDFINLQLTFRVRLEGTWSNLV